MTSCSLSHQYEVQTLAEQLHEVPRRNSRFGGSQNTFAPSSSEYVEGLGFWAVLFAVAGSFLFLFLVICVLCKSKFCQLNSLAVGRDQVEKSDVKKSKVVVGVVLLLAFFCGLPLVYGCVESNLFFKVMKDNLQESSAAISSIHQQIISSKAVLQEQVESYLVNLRDLLAKRGTSSQQQNVSITLEIMDNVQAELEDLERIIAFVRISSTADSANLLKDIWLHFSIAAVLWCAVVLITLGFLSLACLPVCLMKMAMVFTSVTILVAFATGGCCFALSLGASDFCVNADENIVAYLSMSDEGIRLVSSPASHELPVSGFLYDTGKLTYGEPDTGSSREAGDEATATTETVSRFVYNASLPQNSTLMTSLLPVLSSSTAYQQQALLPATAHKQLLSPAKTFPLLVLSLPTMFLLPAVSSSVPALSSFHTTNQQLVPLPSIVHVQTLPFDSSFIVMSTPVAMSTVIDGVDGFSCTNVYLSSIVLSTEVVRLRESQMRMPTSSVDFTNTPSDVISPLPTTASVVNLNQSDVQAPAGSVNRGKNRSGSFASTLMDSHQYTLSYRKQVIYCKTSMFASTSMQTPVQTHINTQEPITTYPSTTALPPASSDLVLAHFVYCSKNCSDVFTNHLTGVHNKLHYMNNTLVKLTRELGSIGGSQALLVRAIDGVSSLNLSLTLLEERTRCSEIHELYTEVRDRACDKGIISLFTMACSSFLLGIICFPLFVCLRRTDLRRILYNRSYQNGTCISSTLRYTNQATSSRQRAEPPPSYSTVIGIDSAQASDRSNVNRIEHEGTVYLNAGSPVEETAPRLELTYMRFQLGLDSSNQ